MKADFQLTDEGLRQENLLSIGTLSKRIFKINYQPLGDKWYLQSVWQQATGSVKLNSFRYVTEYAATKIDTNYKKEFTYAEKLYYGEILSLKAVPFSKNFWDSYNVIAETETLKELLIDTTISTQDDQPKIISSSIQTRKPSKFSKTWILEKFAPIFIFPSLSNAGISKDFMLSYKNSNNEIIINQSIAGENRFLIGLGNGLAYNYNKNTYFKLQASSEFGLFTNMIYDLGVNYQRNLNTAHKRPIRLLVGMDYSFYNLSRKLNSYNSIGTVNISGKDFNNDLKITLISKQQAIKPTLGINVDVNKMLTGFVEGGYLFNLIQYDALKFIQKPSNILQRLFPITQEVSISSTGVNIESNNQPIYKIPYINQFNFRVGFKGLIRFRH